MILKKPVLVHLFNLAQLEVFSFHPDSEHSNWKKNFLVVHVSSTLHVIANRNAADWLYVNQLVLRDQLGSLLIKTELHARQRINS